MKGDRLHSYLLQHLRPKIIFRRPDDGSEVHEAGLKINYYGGPNLRTRFDYFKFLTIVFLKGNMNLMRFVSHSTQNTA